MKDVAVSSYFLPIISAERELIFNLDVVTLAQIFQCPGHKLAASVCHNFGGQMMARPVLWVNVYPVLMAKTDLVCKSVLKQQTQRILPALQTYINASNQAAVGIDHRVNDRSANGLAGKAADDVDVGNGGIGHIHADGVCIIADRASKRTMIALIGFKSLPADGLADGVAVLTKEIAELPERGIFRLQCAVCIAVFRPQHHFVGGLQALPLRGVVILVQCPADGFFIGSKLMLFWRGTLCG